MIKLTLREAHAINKHFPLLPRMNAKTAYDFKRIRDEIQVALKPTEEQKAEIMKAHGGQFMGDGVIKWSPPEGEQAANKEYDELFDKEVEIDREPIKLKDILGPDPAKYPEMQPELLSVLEKIIVE